MRLRICFGMNDIELSCTSDLEVIDIKCMQMIEYIIGNFVQNELLVSRISSYQMSRFHCTMLYIVDSKALCLIRVYKRWIRSLLTSINYYKVSSSVVVTLDFDTEFVYCITLLFGVRVYHYQKMFHSILLCLSHMHR